MHVSNFAAPRCALRSIKFGLARVFAPPHVANFAQLNHCHRSETLGLHLIIVIAQLNHCHRWEIEGLKTWWHHSMFPLRNPVRRGAGPYHGGGVRPGLGPGTYIHIPFGSSCAFCWQHPFCKVFSEQWSYQRLCWQRCFCLRLLYMMEVPWAFMRAYLDHMNWKTVFSGKQKLETIWQCLPLKVRFGL